MPASTSSTVTIAIAVIVVAIIIIGAVALARRNRSKSMQDRFGPEYERAVRESGGSRADAERELARRQERVKRMHIEELPAGAKTRYTEEWRTVQTRFVDEPEAALIKADRLITNVMRDRGYTVDNYDQTVADLSPDHPNVLQNYRTAHDITRRSETGEVTTEDLRQAMVQYRSLFDDLM
ncbi:MAG: hypothetical protein JO322_10825 [Candidatus Eremiobacteraeota bacterium]|nr:hypothetical protein [Candidatus Eremiobacteraeota bacterium]